MTILGAVLPSHNSGIDVFFQFPENKESFLKALQDIQKFEREPFKVNCNKMLADFDRNNIAENLIKFIV